MEINTDRIRGEMKNRDQWLCWEAAMRDGKETKLPKDPATGRFAQTDDPSTWGAFINATGKVRKGDMDGIGFVFTEDDNFVGIDLDDCRDPDAGEWDDWALDVMQDIGGWIEISPSGTGAHIILKGKIPGGRNRKGNIEIYEDGRFFTVTGQLVDENGEPLSEDEETPEIKEAQQALDAVYDRFLAEDDESANETDVDVDPSRWGHLDLEDHDGKSPASHSRGPNLDDLPEELRDIVETAKSANNGYHFTQLWRGNWEGKYPSHSEGDMAFCDMLAFWFSGDPERVDRVFRASGLMRPKWDDVRYSDGSTYGERTIEKAVAEVDDHYNEEHYDDLVDENEDDGAHSPTATDSSPPQNSDSNPDNDTRSNPTSADSSTGEATSEEPETQSATEPNSDSATKNTEQRGKGRRRESGRKRSNKRRDGIPDDIGGTTSSGDEASSDSDTSTRNGNDTDDETQVGHTELEVDSWDKNPDSLLNGDKDSTSGEEDQSDQGDNDEIDISDDEAIGIFDDDDEDTNHDESSTPSSTRQSDQENNSKAQPVASSEDTTPSSPRSNSQKGTDQNNGSDDGDSSRSEKAGEERIIDEPIDNVQTLQDLQERQKEFEENIQEHLERLQLELDGENIIDEPIDNVQTLQEFKDRQEEFEENVQERVDILELDVSEKKLKKRVEDNEQNIQEVDDGLRNAKTQLKHDNELVDDKLERVYHELQKYEKIVDKRESQLETMFQLFVLLSHVQPEPLFDQVENILLAADEIPEENIFADSIGNIINDHNNEATTAGTSSVTEPNTLSDTDDREEWEEWTDSRPDSSSNSENNDDNDEDRDSFLSQFF